MNGKEVLQAVKALAEEREKDERALLVAWSRVLNAPSWVPKCTEDEWYRVRAAEKVVLLEEAWRDCKAAGVIKPNFLLGGGGSGQGRAR